MLFSSTLFSGSRCWRLDIGVYVEKAYLKLKAPMLEITALKWLWDNKGMIGIGALIVGLCILFGVKEVELKKVRLDLTTAKSNIVTLEAKIKVQNIAVEQLGADTVAQRAEVARLLKLAYPKAKALADAAEAAKARISASEPIINVPADVARISVRQPSECKRAIFDAALDLGELK